MRSVSSIRFICFLSCVRFISSTAVAPLYLLAPFALSALLVMLVRLALSAPFAPFALLDVLPLLTLFQ